MARDTTKTRRKVPLGPIAAAAAGALVVGLAVIAPGFDAQQTPVDSGTVWAMQNGAGLRYARINAELGELETVKVAENPSALVQTSNDLLLFTDGNSKMASIDLAQPDDVDGSSENLQDTPAGTQVVVSAGDFVGYLTDSGRVYGSRVADGASPAALDPLSAEERDAGDKYVSSAIAVDESGKLYSYSADTGSVQRFDIATATLEGEDTVPSPPDAAGVAITAVAGTWVLLSPNGDAWIRGQSDPLSLSLTGQAVLQRSSTSAEAVLVAHEGGLISVELSSGAASTLLGADGLGIPAAPIRTASDAFAAWLPEGDGPGTLWSLSAGESVLDFAGQQLDRERQPEFQSNGSRAILNEIRSGWVWTLPDGDLVASSQDWSLNSTEAEQQEPTEQEPPRVLDPKPPVAVADQFGARAGSIASLPVLLNDSDPNEDVLTIIPESLVGLDPAFGTVTVTNNNQQLSVQLQPGASGAASFTYQITDGTSADGLNSGATSVSLSVAANDANSAPVWCGVSGCLTEWPSPQVIPGGTVSVDALKGWVDPEGDPIFIAGATNSSGIGSVVPTPEGRIVFQHPNPNAVESSTIPIDVVVSDVRGATTSQLMNIRVTATPTLEAESFALVAALGDPVLVDPGSHINGVAGPLTLTSAKALSSAPSSVTTNPSEATFTFDADAAGNYLVNYTVTDGVSEVTGLVRVTLVPADTEQLTTAPVVAFVRPKEDATINVFSAVSNPAGRVLLLSDVSSAAESTSTLSVDVVAQSLLRVSGTTDNGQPGLLGVVSYTVSDGTGNANATTRGTASVYLLDSSAPAAPIAIDDALTIRSGQQADIPVLDNDVAAGGSSIGLDPSSLQNVSEAGLAFASGRLVRYLAPDEPGIYEIFYTAYTAGFPELTDTAKITVTVRAADSNVAPTPRLITGRVLSGQTVAMRFDPRGVDPDGDTVILDRITTQPDSGSAAISADGTSLVYTSVAGFRGQVDFEYQVRDSLGEIGTAVARVGVLDGKSDPRPITYSDYVQLRVGSDSEVAINPILNDVDPSGSPLEVIEVTPDAQPGTAEYDSLAALIGEQTGNTVKFSAGEVLGSMSFIYTVANDRGDTSQGFIVLTVVRAAVADYPIVTDTILTAANRDTFTTGADVVTGKVAWTAGDAAGLTLSLWGDVPDVTVTGSRIKGALPDRTILIPFQLTGPNYAGEEVTSYGFLKVLGEDELRLALIDPDVAQEVDEKGEISFDLATLVEYSKTDSLEIDAAGVVASGRRASAVCEFTSGTTIRYTAGTEAPWNDSCTIPVKMTRQEFFTYVTVQIRVIAEDPQPELTSGSLTVSPGAQATYDLAQMVSWQGRGETSSVEFAVNTSGTQQFTVEQSGQTLTVTGLDAARTGTEERISVSIVNYEGVEPAGVTLQVGLAPSTLPKGATVSQQCSQASGSSCEISVIGGSGEVNPLPGTPLKVVGVVSPSACTGVTFAAGSSGTVVASWTADAAGATCTGTFVVEDAQGRQSSGDRDGVVTLDLQGYPLAPASISQVDYTADSVTMRVEPGAAASAYPAITGFIVSGGEQSVTCSASGECPSFTGLTNGTKIVYTAVAVNSVGNSLAAVESAEAWAYRSPAQPEVKALAVFREGRTTAAEGVVEVTVSTKDTQGTGRYRINGVDYEFTSGSTTIRDIVLPVGPGEVTAEALSGFAKPPASGPTDATASTVVPVGVVGLPTVATFEVWSQVEGVIEAKATAGADLSTNASVFYYVASATGSGATCDVDSTGRLIAATPEGKTSGRFDTRDVREYTVSACVGNGFGAVVTELKKQNSWGPGPGIPSGTFAVDTVGTFDDVTGTASYKILDDGFGIPPVAGYVVKDAGIPDTWGEDPKIKPRYCTTSQPELCGAPGSVTHADPGPPYQMRVTGIKATQCVIDGSEPTGTSDAIVGGSANFVLSGISYTVAGQPEPVSGDGLTVPAGATQFTATVSLLWINPALSSHDFSVSGNCRAP